MRPYHTESNINEDLDDRSKWRSFPWKIYLIVLALALLAAVIKIPAVIFSIGAIGQPQDWMLISVMSVLQTLSLSA